MTFDDLIESGLFLLFLVGVPFWLLHWVYRQCWTGESLDDRYCSRRWDPEIALTPWLETRPPTPSVDYYAQYIQTLAAGDLSHRRASAYPVQSRRHWKALDCQLNRLEVVSPLRLRTWFCQLQAALGPLWSLRTITDYDRERHGPAIPLGELIWTWLGTLLRAGVRSSLDPGLQWYRILLHWPELFEDPGWMLASSNAEPPLPAVLTPAHWFSQTGTISEQVAYLRRPHHHRHLAAARREQVDWQRLWYHCCREEPHWALVLADYPEVDTHADGENGYALLLRSGHLEEADRLVREHGVDWAILEARCQLPGVLAQAARRPHRRAKSARAVGVSD